MTRPIHVAGLCCGLLVLPLSARAEPDGPLERESGAPVVAERVWDAEPVDAEPTYAEPAEVAPPATAQPPPQAATPQGEWVDTQQYGRIWMPYSDAYTSTPPDGYGEPYQYVYYPAYGWSWVAAPWIWGWGPWPTFGLYGPAHFGWYCRGWWRTPSRWHYAPAARFGGYERGWAGGHRGGWAPPVRGYLGARSYGSPGFRPGAPGFRSSGSGYRGGAPAHRGFAAPSGGGRPGGGSFHGGGHRR